jgi:hypothetical protein
LWPQNLCIVVPLPFSLYVYCKSLCASLRHRLHLGPNRTIWDNLSISKFLDTYAKSFFKNLF